MRDGDVLEEDAAAMQLIQFNAGEREELAQGRAVVLSDERRSAEGPSAP
jgi:hypothetical protein